MVITMAIRVPKLRHDRSVLRFKLGEAGTPRLADQPHYEMAALVWHGSNVGFGMLAPPFDDRCPVIARCGVPMPFCNRQTKERFARKDMQEARRGSPMQGMFKRSCRLGRHLAIE